MWPRHATFYLTKPRTILEQFNKVGFWYIKIRLVQSAITLVPYRCPIRSLLPSSSLFGTNHCYLLQDETRKLWCHIDFHTIVTFYEMGCKNFVMLQR